MGIAPKINGTSIKEPTDFDVEKYKLSKSGRVASGKMTMEIIAKKKKFNFWLEGSKGNLPSPVFLRVFSQCKGQFLCCDQVIIV